MKKNKSNLKERMQASMKEKPKSGGRLLALPKGVSLLTFDEDVETVKMDFVSYRVKDKKHPDEGLAVVGEGWYRRPYKIHRGIGAKNKSYVCRQSIGGKCPICEHQAQLFAKDMREEAIKLYPKDRDLYVPIPLDSEKHEAEPVYVWDMAESLFQNCLSKKCEKNPDILLFADLEEGLTLELTFKWDTIGKKGKPFPEVVFITSKKRKPYDESILDEVPNLDDIITASTLSYEDLKAAYFEMEDDDEDNDLKDDEDYDETPRNKKHVTNKSRVVKDDEDEDDKDDDEDDEDDTKVPRKKKATSKSTHTKRSNRRDEEDEDEDDDNDEIKLTRDAAKVFEEDRCVACQGSGLNSRGKTCPICKGTGIKPEEDEDDDEDETPQTSKKHSMKRGGRSESSNKCPYGHKFGTDSEKFDDCDDCEIWSGCADEKDKQRSKK